MLTRASRARIPVLVASVAIVVLTAVGSAAPAEASPQQQARDRAAATLAEVRAAAAGQDETVPVTAQVAVEAPEATATVKPGHSSKLAAGALGAATFSGHGIDGELSMSMSRAPDAAARVARSETAGVVASKVVQIDAKSADGRPVTSFPALRTNTRGGDDGSPQVSDVTPGIALELAVDQAAVKKAGLDAASLRIYTRETPGEPWTALPSYYDSKSKTVKGESDHLSQFVVIGVPFVAPPGPVIVLDPDNDEGHASSPATVSELPYNVALANGLVALLQQQCHARVTVTRDASLPYVSRQLRANIAAAANPVLTLGIGFNTWLGHAWGSDGTDGGSQLYSRGGALDQAVTGSLIAELPGYTGRPAKQLPATADFPHPEFGPLPGAVTHLEALFLDHNYDWAVIANGFQHIVNGVFTGMGKFLETRGFDCTDPVTGGWPDKPSAAELERWRHLGHQNYQTYGAEPVSFATGNLIEDVTLFTLPGVGGQSLDLTLTYNSQDGRLTRTGAGWSFGLGARAQRFSDGSVMVVRGDGASYVFNPNGAGGYASEPGLRQTLAESGGGDLTLSSTDGESWVFAAGDIEGIGELVTHTDRHGNSYSLGYGAAADGQQFVPLTSITDRAGQVVAVGNDAAGRVTSFTLPDGRAWGLGYDGAGNLTAIRLPDDRTRTFTYDGAHQLLTATDPLGATYLANTYDAAGRVTKQIDPDGNIRRLDYSTPGQTVYTDNEGRRTVFHVDGQRRITKIVNAAGGAVAYEYDEAHQVVKQSDENGETTAYGYDGRGNVSRVTHPDGTIVKYTYTPTGEVASVTDQGGPGGTDRTTTFDVDARGLTTGEHRPDGTAVTTEHNTHGDLIRTTSPSGASTTYGYDARGNLTSVTDPDGHITKYGYDVTNRVTSSTDPNGNATTFAWDAGDRLTSRTDAAGGVTRYEYDGNDRLSRQTDPDGGITSYTWNAMFDLVEVTAPDAGVTRYEYNTENTLTKAIDPVGAVTAFAVDALDRITAVTDPNGGDWTRSYDKVGNVVASKDPRGASTTNTYDRRGRLLSTKGPTGVTQTTTYDQIGRIASQADASGAITAYQYDAMDRVVRVTDPSKASARFVYDADGNMSGTIDRHGNASSFTYSAGGVLATVADPTGAVTTLTSDANGNVTTVTDALGRARSFVFDDLNRIVKATNQVGSVTTVRYDPMGRVLAAVDPLGNTTSTSYDAAGRTARVTDAVGAVTRYGYDRAGHQTSATDGNGNTTRYSYDPAGQLIKVVEGFAKYAAADADTNVATAYVYDTVGNLIGITDPNGKTTSFEFDSAGNMTKETNPIGNTWAYTYDNRGLLTEKRDANGRGRFDYSSRGDLVSVTYPGQTVSFEYDANQQLIAMTDSTGVTGWTYDRAGRLTKQIDSNRKTLSYVYDPVGDLTGLTMPTGERVGYEYDAASRVIAQTSPWGSIAYDWDAASNLIKQTRSTGLATTYAYDADNRVTSIAHRTPQPTEPVAAPVASLLPEVKRGAVQQCAGVDTYLAGRTLPNLEQAAKTCVKSWDYLADRTMPVPTNPVGDGDQLRFDYTYDRAGNVASATRSLAPPATFGPGEEDQSAPTTTATVSIAKSAKSKVLAREFGYDALNRLTTSTVSAGQTDTYGYDPSGNRTSWSRTGGASDFTMTATFNDANQLTATRRTNAAGAVGVSYAYDGVGNRVGQQADGVSSSYQFDPTGRMTAATQPGRTTSYAYDGLGRQVSSTDTTDKGGPQTTTQVWAGASVVQQDNSAHGATTLIRDAAGELALQAGTATGTRWDLLDRLGSTVAQAVGGSITQLADYADFGEQSFETTGWSAPLSFSGEASDPGYGLNQYYARSYDPTTATWTSADPYRGLLTQPQTLHRYGYVTNNPTTHWDVLGFASSNMDWTRQPGNEGNCQEAYPRPPCKNAKVGPIINTNYEKPTAPAPTKQAVKDPKAQSAKYEQKRHVDGAKPPFPDWVGQLSAVLSSIGLVAGILGWVPGLIGIFARAIGAMAGALNAGLTCATNTVFNCIMGIVGAVLAALGLGSGTAVEVLRVSKTYVVPWILKQIDSGVSALGNSSDLLATITSWGDYLNTPTSAGGGK